jgi:hypothetical protein
VGHVRYTRWIHPEGNSSPYSHFHARREKLARCAQGHFMPPRAKPFSSDSQQGGGDSPPSARRGRLTSISKAGATHLHQRGRLTSISKAGATHLHQRAQLGRGGSEPHVQQTRLRALRHPAAAAAAALRHRRPHLQRRL